MGDISDLIPDDKADVCVLEEPEHLNWYVQVQVQVQSRVHYIILKLFLVFLESF